MPLWVQRVAGVCAGTPTATDGDGGASQVRRRQRPVQRGFLDLDVGFLVAQCVDDDFAMVWDVSMLHHGRQPRSRGAGVLLADDGDEFLCCW